MSTPFKMKGFSGFGNTPLNKKRKLTSTEEDSPNPNRIYVSDKFKIGDVLDEDDLGFTQTGDDPANYPQYSIQDYSKVRRDPKGRNYVVNIGDEVEF